MKRLAQISLAVVLSVSPMAISGTAQAKGCLKGAAVGGLAGHMAGHGVLGAAGGCAVGHHMAHRHDNDQYPSRNYGSQEDSGGYSNSDPNSYHRY